MLKVLGLILMAVVVAVGAVVGFAATKPASFKVVRSAVIEAPPEKIFPRIDNLAAWRGWSPYEGKDLGLKRTYSGPASGVGAVYAWSGNPKTIGAGSMEITQSVPSSKIVFDLKFTAPFKAHNTATFLLEPQGGSTRVTWETEGPSPLISKVMGLFINMDEMIGGDFAKGLATLKAQAEA